MNWLFAPHKAASPWLPQRIVHKRQQVHVIVRSINVEGTTNFLTEANPDLAQMNSSLAEQDYPIRLRTFSSLFYTDWPTAIGIVGVQQTKTQMTNCPMQPARDNGTHCFARLLQARYVASGQQAESVAGTYTVLRRPIELGMIAGSPWQILDHQVWKIGKDRLRWDHLTKWVGISGGSRYVQGALLRNAVTGWKFRFYNTHLSHNADDLNHNSDRRAQIENMKAIIESQVRPDELPPMVVGDFNFAADNPSNTMAEDFDLAHASGIDQIWIGRQSVFNTQGELTVIGKSIVRLAVPFRIGDANFEKLSDHNSPAVALRIVV